MERMLVVLVALASLIAPAAPARLRVVPGSHLQSHALNRVSIPHFDTWNGIGPLGDDPLAQVRSILDMYDRHDREARVAGADAEDTALLEVSAGAKAGTKAGVGKVH